MSIYEKQGFLVAYSYLFVAGGGMLYVLCVCHLKSMVCVVGGGGVSPVINNNPFNIMLFR